jgi:DNA polymerase III delta subunit
MYALYHEMQKLFIYKADARVITPDDVRRVVSSRYSNTAYDILDGILKREPAAALIAFKSYCREHDSFVELTAFLGSYFEKLYRMAALREGGMSSDNIADVVGVPKFLVRTKYLPKVSYVGRGWISKCLEQVVELDAGLRLHKARRVLVERFLMSVSAPM